MRKAVRFLALTAGLVVFATACGDDTPTGTNSGDPLTTQEALDVYVQLNAAIGQALGGVTAPAATPGASQDPIPTVSANCPYGGSVSVSGDYDIGDFNTNTGEGTISFSLTESISSCGVMSGDIEFTVNGDPNITVGGDITIAQVNQTFDISGTYTMNGGFRYTSDDGRSGSCAMNVSVNYETFSVSGSICGNSLGN